MVELHILNKSRRLDPFLETIQLAFQEGLTCIQSVLPVDNVDVVVDEDPWWFIPETGVGGRAPMANLVYISVDADSPHLNNLKNEIKSTLAHELHHCARSATVGYGKTLWEALITEGLADHFDIEINNSSPRPWSKALSEPDILNLLEIGKVEFNDEKYNHEDWFFGNQERGIPRWAGYSMAFYIIAQYLNNNSGYTASSLYNKPAIEFN